MVAHSQSLGLSAAPGGVPLAPQPAGPLPCAQMQFTGSFRGCSWNTQALFARRVDRQRKKMQHARRLFAAHDFAVWQETHSTQGRARMLRLPRECTAHWSHDSTHTAGVGLWIRHSFLQHFNPAQAGDWVEIVPGRAAVLRLNGPLGSLDIFVVYMHTGAAHQDGLDMG